MPRHVLSKYVIQGITSGDTHTIDTETRNKGIAMQEISDALASGEAVTLYVIKSKLPPEKKEEPVIEDEQMARDRMPNQ